MAYIEPQATPVTSKSLYSVMWSYFHRDGIRPNAQLLVAHWALETGWGKKCMNWNIGNLKLPRGPESFTSVVQEGDLRKKFTLEPTHYTYFPTFEYIKPTAIQSIESNQSVIVTDKVNREGRVKVRFYPRHSACCFRAYNDLEQGVYDYLDVLKQRFGDAWNRLQDADCTPESFAHALKHQRYYTASEEDYAAGLARCLKIFRKSLEG